MVSTKDKIFVCTLFLTLIVVHISVKHLVFTGDEPIYVYQGLGAFHDRNFYPSEDIWRGFLDRGGYSFFSYGELSKFRATIFPSFLYAPFFSVWGLESARWANFTVGLFAILTLFLILKRQYKEFNIVAFSIVSVCLSLQLIAYLKLIYPRRF